MLRRALVSFAALSIAMVLSESASAQVVSDKSSSATAPLIWKTRNSFFSINKSIGDDDVNVGVGFSFQPENDVTKDLLKVDMSKGALIEASWGDGKTMTLKSLGTQQKEGFLRAEYQLKPGVEINVDAGPFGNFNHFFDANALLNQGPGTNFNYHAANQANFEPWGWGGASFTIPGAPIATSKLVSATFEKLGIDKDTIEGDVAINMTTTPKFTYKTTSIVLATSTPLTKEGEEVSISAVDTDYLDIEAVVKGRIDYEGSMIIRPTVTVDSIAGFSLPIVIDLIGVADTEVKYGSDPAKEPGDGSLDSPLLVDFPKTTFHIPLPNVKVRTKTLDLGTSTIGQELKKSVQIDNTGEMGASVEFESSDPQFKVSKATQISSKGKYDLEVVFVPANAGPASGKITVKSNDPNEPKVEILLTANGAALPDPVKPAPAAEPEPQGFARPGSDSGCGCVVVGQKATTTGAGASLVALGLLAVGRRRRRG